MKPEDFLDSKGREMVVTAIKEAEKNTSGEIRVHIDGVCKGDTYRKAVEVFYRLGMEKTAARNGVLIYVACSSKVFAIIGDTGINEAVPADFWNEVSGHIGTCFRQGRFAEGLADAVKMAGAKLKAYFPYNIILADSILFLGMEDQTPSYHAFASTNFKSTPSSFVSKGRSL